MIHLVLFRNKMIFHYFSLFFHFITFKLVSLSETIYRDLARCQKLRGIRRVRPTTP